MQELILGFTSISTINIFLITLAWVIFAFVLWRLAKQWGGAQNSFDISVVGTLIALLFHRVLYVIFYVDKFSSSYWSMYPYSWDRGYRVVFGTKPWIALAFWRGGCDYRIILFAVMFSIFVINFFLQWRLIDTLEAVVIAVSSSFPVVVILAWVNSLYSGVDFYNPIVIPKIGWTITKHPIHTYQIGLFFLLVVVQYFAKKKFKKIKHTRGFLFGSLLLFCNAIVLYYYGYGISQDTVSWLIGLGSVMGVVGLWRMSLGGDSIKQVETENQPFRRKFSNVTQRSYRRFG